MSRWPAWAAGATLAFAAVTAASYVWDPCASGLWALLLLALLTLIAAGSGRVLLNLLGLSDISESQKTLIGVTLGLGLLSLTVLLLAACGVLYAWSVTLALALLWIAGFSQMRPVLRSLTFNRNLLGDRPVWALAMLFPLALVGWCAWVPPHQYDSLVYHLPLAQAYVRAHALVPVGYLLYSHFPQNGEMLFALCLILKSDILGQLLAWLAMALSVGWIFEMGKREAPLSAVLLGCLLLCTQTSVMLLSATTYVESFVMLWTTAAVLSFLRWRQLTAAYPAQRSWLALSAVFTGLALGTKYTAGITAAIFGSVLVFRWLLAAPELSRGRRLDLHLYVGAVTALFAPWMIKNLLMVGNPVFPFFYRLFPMTGTGWSAESARVYFNILTEYGHGAGFFRDLVSLPVMLLTNSLRFGRGMDVLGGLGWELIFWSAPLAVWAAWKNRFLRGLLFFCAAYLAAWFCTNVVLRFLIALAPVLCLLAGCGLYGLSGLLGPRGKTVLGAAVGLLTLTHLFLFAFVEEGVFESGRVLLGLETRQEFLSRRLDYYPCASYAAGHLDKNDRILIVGEQRGYYVEQDHAATTVHGPNRYALLANEARSPQDLARRIRGAGFSEILLVPREAKRLGAGLGPFSDRGLANWSGLESGYLKEAFRGPACALYSLAENQR